MPVHTMSHCYSIVDDDGKCELQKKETQYGTSTLYGGRELY